MSGSFCLVSRPCLAAASAAAARARASSTRAARAISVTRKSCSAASTSGATSATAAASSSMRGAAVVSHAKKGGFMAEMEEIKEEEGFAVEFTLPLSVQKYPHKSLRAKNKIIGVFDDELAKLSAAMFKLMYETDGVGLAAPQVGVNYRMMVYNEAGVAGEGKEVTLVNPKIVKFAKQKDLFEEGCLSFPKIYAEVEVRGSGRHVTAKSHPRTRSFSLFFLRKPVSINNKYTLIPAERVPKSDEQTHSEALVETSDFSSFRSSFLLAAFSICRFFFSFVANCRFPSPSRCRLTASASPVHPLTIRAETHGRADRSADLIRKEVQDDPRRLRSASVPARVRPLRRSVVPRSHDR